MSTAGLAILMVGCGFLISQTVLVLQFAIIIRRRSKPLESSWNPSAAIILCIRGADPSLSDCIRSIATQSYLNRKLFLVVDHPEDPGLETALKSVEEHEGLSAEVIVNTEFLETCSLKCSNLIHAIGKIGNDFQYFVLVDADTRPPSDWLQNMLIPFEDSNVAVTTGVRWFNPVGVQPGTHVRHVWNGAAIVQMVCYGIPWGGSLAIRGSFLKQADVLDHWRSGFCEDTMLQRICHQHKMKVKTVTDAILPNDEETKLGECIPWVSRQLLTTRLHHGKWPLVVLHGLMTLMFSIGMIIAMAVAAIYSEFRLVAELAATFLSVQIGNILLFSWICSSVHSRIAHSTTAIRLSLFRQTLAILLTQFCYSWSLLRTLFLRNEVWRKIRYRIRGKQVTRLSYEPYQTVNSEPGTDQNRQSL